MSLELALQQATAAFQRNTAAVEKLIIALTTAPAPLPAEDEPDQILGEQVGGAAKGKKPRAKKEAAPEVRPGEPASEATAPSPEPGATAAPATEDVAAPADPITYKDVTAAAIALIKACGNDKRKAQDIIQSFGVEHSGQLKPEQYPAVIDALNEALNDMRAG
jgi:hypothetical protein